MSQGLEKNAHSLQCLRSAWSPGMVCVFWATAVTVQVSSNVVNIGGDLVTPHGRYETLESRWEFIVTRNLIRNCKAEGGRRDKNRLCFIQMRSEHLKKTQDYRLIIVLLFLLLIKCSGSLWT